VGGEGIPNPGTVVFDDARSISFSPMHVYVALTTRVRPAKSGAPMALIGEDVVGLAESDMRQNELYRLIVPHPYEYL
jgi:hypothetical protein